MRNRLALFFVFLSFSIYGQEDIKFIELRSKAKLAYLKGEKYLAYQNFNKALLINPSCEECQEKCKELAEALKTRKLKKQSPRSIPDFNKTTQTLEVRRVQPKPTYIFQNPITFKVEMASPLGDSLLNTVFISQTEVTQKEWKVFCQETGKQFPEITEKLLNDDFPVVNISWKDAKEYAKWVSEKTGENYDLPSLIEWQTAREAMTDLKSDAWIYNNAERRLHQPCTKAVFSNGLCDIEGNVSEWLEDWSDKSFIEDSKLVSYFEDNENFKSRIVAGCSYRDETFLCKDEPFIRSFDSSIHKDFIGFRLVKRNF